MKFALSILLLFAFATSSHGQDMEHFLQGSVSYQNSKNVYVKFSSTELIEVGDTLFVQNQNQYLAALIVNNKSSISCVCIPLAGNQFNVGDQIIYRRKSIAAQPILISEDELEVETQESLAPATVITPEPDIVELKSHDQTVRGRLSASWYGNYYDSRQEDIH
jgi:hypothetical protein